METFFESRVWAICFPIIAAILTVLIGWVINKLINKWAVKLLAKTKLDPTIHKFIIHALTITVWVVTIISALGRLGIDSTSIVTVLAACGAAVALALQGSLSNLASGLLLMASQTFKKGDYIVSTGVEGTVDSIDLLHTTIITMDNKTVTIPNASLTGNTVTNLTRAGKRRIDIEIGIAYESDIDQARYALVKLASCESYVLQDPAPSCNVSNYADSAIMLTFRMWTTADNYWDVRFSVLNKISDTLASAGISIPFPQLDIHTVK